MRTTKERWSQLCAEINADGELTIRLSRLTRDGLRLWAQRCKARVAAGEPLGDLAWRALHDVRIARAGTPDADVPEML